MTPFPAYWMQTVQKWALRSSSEGHQSRLPTLSFLGAWFLYAHFVHPIPMLLIPIPRLFIPIPGFPILFIFILNVFYLLRWNKVSPSKLSKTIFWIPISDIVSQARLPGESLILGSFNEYFLSLCSSFRIWCGSGAVNEAAIKLVRSCWLSCIVHWSLIASGIVVQVHPSLPEPNLILQSQAGWFWGQFVHQDQLVSWPELEPNEFFHLCKGLNWIIYCPCWDPWQTAWLWMCFLQHILTWYCLSSTASLPWDIHHSPQ